MSDHLKWRDSDHHDRQGRGAKRRHARRRNLAVPVVLAGVLAACGGAPTSGSAAGHSSTTTGASHQATTTTTVPKVTFRKSTLSGWGISPQYARYITDTKMLRQLPTTKTCHPGATKLVYWSWEIGLNYNVNLYNLTHPKVCVDWVDTAGENEDVKLEAAMKAGTGVPDVFHDQRFFATNWILQKKVINLAPYGVNKVKHDFSPSAWHDVAPFHNSSVYAIPWDAGPLGLMYNASAFKKYHLAVPKTWAQFAQEAVSLHKAHPGVYMLNFNYIYSTPIEQLLWWQTGAYPIHWNGGAKLGMNYDLPGAVHAAQYWQKLWKSGALANISGNGSFKALASGKVLTDWAPAWYPIVFQSLAGKTMGDWRIEPLPQWKAGQDAQTNYGGSATYITTASPHKKQAVQFAEWLMTSNPSWFVFVHPPQGLFPTRTSILHNPNFLKKTAPLTGPQHYEQVYANILDHVNTKWEWSPIEPAVATVMSDEFKKVISGKATLPGILPAIQSQLTSQAKSDGFTVVKK